MQSGGANSPVARPHPFLSKAGRQIVQDARASRSRDSAPKLAGPKHRKAAAGGKPAARPPWRHVGGRLAAENQPATPAPRATRSGPPGCAPFEGGQGGECFGPGGGRGGQRATAAAEDLSKLTVKKLQARLKQMELATNGRKAELIARLQAAL